MELMEYIQNQQNAEEINYGIECMNRKKNLGEKDT